MRDVVQPPHTIRKQAQHLSSRFPVSKRTALHQVEVVRIRDQPDLVDRIEAATSSRKEAQQAIRRPRRRSSSDACSQRGVASRERVDHVTRDESVPAGRCRSLESREGSLQPISNADTIGHRPTGRRSQSKEVGDGTQAYPRSERAGMIFRMGFTDDSGAVVESASCRP